MLDTSSAIHKVDVLIVTAIGLEFDAVLKVDEGAALGHHWEECVDSQKLRLAIRTFMTINEEPLRVAVAQAASMRAEAAVDRAVALLPILRPRCLAMCGVCAGRPGKVNLGDVIAATLVWAYDHTALIVRQDGSGEDLRQALPETRTYNIPPQWVHKIEKFSLSAKVVQRLQEARPHPLQPQIDWILLRVAMGVKNPGSHNDVAKFCPDYALAITEAWRRGDDQWLVDGTLKLTAAGKARAERLRILHEQGFPELAKEAFRLRAAPLATSNQLVRDEVVWDTLQNINRDVAGLEMEASAIGAVAERNGISEWVVMKGVMDFAHRDKDDRFKQFAASASAETLIAFLRNNLSTVRNPSDSLESGLIPAVSGVWLATNSSGAVIEPQIAEAHGRGDIEAAKDLRRAERSGTSLARNTILMERYLVLEIVGSGGFSDVWKARDLKNGSRLVAVKVLHGQFARDKSMCARFKRGARNQAKLANHPHVVAVLDPICEYDGFHFFVMEYVEGDNLEAAAAKGITLDQVGRIVTAIGNALTAAHNLQIIHRDVKPTNILLDRQGQAYLTDFDLVLAYDTTGGTRTGALGTFMYAAPEAMERAKDADKRVDVYGFGMTIVYMLLQKSKLPHRILRDPEEVLRRLTISRAAQAILAKAIEWFPEGRYKSISDFVEALKAALVRPVESSVIGADLGLIGATFGHFELIKLLRDGHMGQVYKAADKVTHRHVALKLLKGHAPDIIRRRFRREARLGASFASENIPRVFQVGTDDIRDTHWFVMDYLKGRNIDWFLDQGIPMDISWIIDVLSQALNALKYLHLRGVVHCGVRPGHIFVEIDLHDSTLQTVKILDFSSAYKMDDTIVHEPTGNPRYLAPEQTLPSAEIDHRADLYAIGVVFFELMTGGRHPFSLPPSHFRSQNLTIEQAKAIDNFFFKATGKTPEDRFANASDMKAALTALAGR